MVAPGIRIYAKLRETADGVWILSLKRKRVLYLFGKLHRHATTSRHIREIPITITKDRQESIYDISL